MTKSPFEANALKRLQRHEREALEAAQEAASAAGCTAIPAGFGSKGHLKIEIWRDGEQIGATTVSGSPRDRTEAVRNTGRLVARICLGAYGGRAA